MIGLTSVVCSLMVASTPMIEDAPCREEISYVPSAQLEEGVGELERVFTLSETEPFIAPVDVETSLYKAQGSQEVSLDMNANAPPNAMEASLEEPKIDFDPSEVHTDPQLANLPVVVNSPITAESEEVVLKEPLLAVEKEVPEIRETRINMNEVFSGAPVIYSLLFLLSLSAFTLWIYHLLLTRNRQLMPKDFASAIESHLATGNWQEALVLCRKESNLLAILVSAAIAARHEGSQAMIERMQTEGKRATSFFWQRLSLLNDIALIAPMIGLLGTVLGMFYAFYDVNRSIESMYALFDGLGISVATTVGGLIVAIMALFFQSSLKYRLVRQFAIVESRAQQIALHPMAQPLNLQPRENHELST